MLSMEGVQGSRPLSRAGGGAGVNSGDDRGDESVQRMESLRELLVAALHHHPDLPVALCVKSEFPISLCVQMCVQVVVVVVVAVQDVHHFERPWMLVGIALMKHLQNYFRARR